MPLEEFDPSANNPFVGSQPDFDREIAQRSRAFVSTDNVETTPSAKKPTLKDHWGELNTKEKATLIGAGATVATLAAVGIAGLPEIIDSANGPEYSTSTTTYTVQPGDSWWSVAEAIKGHDQVDQNVLISHIKGDPANIDVLKSDTLQPGQSIVIPTSVNQ